MLYLQYAHCIWNINTVFITTPHNYHSDQVCEGIKNNKNIFVEKPLAINLKQLEEVKTCMDERGKSSQILMIGLIFASVQ